MKFVGAAFIPNSIATLSLHGHLERVLEAAYGTGSRPSRAAIPRRQAVATTVWPMIMKPLWSALRPVNLGGASAINR
jgi:hypothetical protein